MVVQNSVPYRPRSLQLLYHRMSVVSRWPASSRGFSLAEKTFLYDRHHASPSHNQYSVNYYQLASWTPTGHPLHPKRALAALRHARAAQRRAQAQDGRTIEKTGADWGILALIEVEIHALLLQSHRQVVRGDGRDAGVGQLEVKIIP